MYPASWTSHWSVALSLAIWLAFCAALSESIRKEGEKTATATTTEDCSPKAVGNVEVTNCCRTYLEIHSAIMDCLPRANQTSVPCVAQCVLQRYRARHIIDAGPITLSTLLTLGPKLAANFETCKQDLFEFMKVSSFEGDFRQVMCNERLDRFLDCFVKSWYTNCFAFADDVPGCSAALTYMQSSNCTFASLFLA